MGPLAHEVARASIARLRERFTSSDDPADVVALLRDLHEASTGSIGAAVGLCVVDARTGGFAYLAVGNVRAAVVGQRRFTGVSRDGVLGRRWPTPFVQRSALGTDDLLLLWTDGLPEALGRQLHGRSHALGRGGSLRGAPPSQWADVLLDAHGKLHDDAALLLLWWRG